MRYNFNMSIDTLEKINPKQALAIENYKNPTSETFGNLKQSMIKAGFSENYADTVTGKGAKWLAESVKRDVLMVKKSEENLYSVLSELIDWSQVKESDKAKLQMAASEFILKSLASKKYKPEEEKQSANVQVNIVNYGSTKPDNDIIECEIVEG